MNTRSVPPPTTSARSTSTSGSTPAKRASTSAWIALMAPFTKKSGRAPTFDLHRRRPAPTRKLCRQDTTARLPSHLAPAGAGSYGDAMDDVALSALRELVDRYLGALAG